MASTVQLVAELKDSASAGFERLSSVIGGIGKIAVGVGAVGGAAFAGLAAAGVSLNARMEQTSVAFTTLLGSAEKAGSFLKDLQQFAASTPFEFPELAQAAQKLLAFGFEAKNIIPLMTSIGDAVGALGGSAADVDRVTMALGQMQAKGKASNEELLQMAELGLPVYDILAKAFGKSTGEIQKMVSDGLIPADQAIQALANGFEDRFGGSMAQQSRTFNGLLSTLKDNAGLALQAFTGPLFEQAKGGLETLGNLVSSPAFQQFAADMGQKVGNALATVVQWLTPIITGFYQIGAAILSSSDPIATILDLLDTLIPGFADAAASAYAWGANIVSQLAAGMGAAVDAVISVINTIASIIAYWFAPGSPPKVAPEIDAWGQAAGTEFFKGIANADISPVNGLSKKIGDALSDLSGQVNTALKDMVDIGALGELDRIPALQGFRQQMMDALIEIEDFGKVSDTTWGKVVDSLGPVKVSMAPVIRGYLDMAAAQGKVSDAQDTLDQITGKYKKQLDGLNTQLKATQREFDKALRPFNDQLDALDRQEDAIKRVQRAQEAKDTLKDPEATDEEKALARLELQRIELEKQMAPIEANRDAAVQAIQDQIDATETQRDAEVAAAQATLDTYQAQLDAATKLYQNEQARVQTIQDSNGLLAEQARLVEQAAKAAAAGGGGGKGGGGGGGLKLPGGAGGLGKGLDLSKIIPEGATGKLAEAGKAIDGIKTKLETARQTVEGWRASWNQMTGEVQQKIAPVVQAFGVLSGNFEKVVGVIAGITAGFGAFRVLLPIAQGVALAFGGISAAAAYLGSVWATISGALAEGFGLWTSLRVVLGGVATEGIGAVVAALGGPLTIAIAAIAALIAALAAAWATNFGGIRDAVDQAWVKIQPVFAQLVAWMGAQIPVVLGALAALWTNVLQPALLVVAEFIANVLIPGLADLIVWLGTNIPAAIQAASDFWNNTLLPALNAVWSFIQDNVIPIFTTVADWLNTTIPAAAGATATMWTGTLQPALNAVWSFLQNNVLPILDALANVYIAAVMLEARLLASLWTDTLQPALSAVWSFIQANVIPILDVLANTAIAGVKLQIQQLVDLWNTTLKPALDALASLVSGAVSSAWDGLATKISGVGSALSALKGIVNSAIGWLNGLATKIDNINSKSVKDFGSGGGSSGSFGSSGSSNRSFAGITRIAAAGPALDGVTKSMQAMATALTFVAERAHDVAIWDVIAQKTKALAGNAKTTAELYKQLGNNVAFLADALTTYKEVEDKNSKGKVVGSHMEPDKIGLTDGELAAFQKEFDAAAAKAYEIQKQFGQEAAKAYYESQSSYLQDEAKLQIAYNNETNDAKKAAIKEQMNLRWKQHQQELAALEEEQGAALDAIEAERQAAEQAYQERMQQIMDLFNEQKKANLSGAADLYSAFADTAGTVGDMLASSYQDAYDKALAGMQPPDPGTLSNADLEKQYADYAAAVKAAEAAGQAAQAQIAQVQQQLAAAQQQALEISQIDPQAAADYYALEKDYILQVNDLQQKLNAATTDEQRAAIQQQLDYLAQAHGFNEQLFQANLDQYGQQLQDAQQAAQDAADETGDSALQTYAGQLAEMFRLFQQQLNSAVMGATGSALGLPGIATMPNLTTRNGFTAQPAGNTTITFEANAIVIQGYQVKNDKELARLIADEVRRQQDETAQSAERLSRNTRRRY